MVQISEVCVSSHLDHELGATHGQAEHNYSSVQDRHHISLIESMIAGAEFKVRWRNSASGDSPPGNHWARASLSCSTRGVCPLDIAQGLVNSSCAETGQYLAIHASPLFSGGSADPQAWPGRTRLNFPQSSQYKRSKHLHRNAMSELVSSSASSVSGYCSATDRTSSVGSFGSFKSWSASEDELHSAAAEPGPAELDLLASETLSLSDETGSSTATPAFPDSSGLAQAAVVRHSAGAPGQSRQSSP